MILLRVVGSEVLPLTYLLKQDHNFDQSSQFLLLRFCHYAPPMKSQHIVIYDWFIFVTLFKIL